MLSNGAAGSSGTLGVAGANSSGAPASGGTGNGGTGNGGGAGKGAAGRGGAAGKGGAESGGTGNGGAAGKGGAANGGGGTSGAAGKGGGAGGGTSAAGAGGGTSTHVGKWRIMPLGDSTTAATCVRARLWGRLMAANKTAIDFVGTETSTGCSDSLPANFDQNNEGHSCYIVSNIINQGVKPSCVSNYASDSTDLARWFDSQTPEIVLMHFGTNDVWNGYGPNMILPAYKAILDKLRSRNATVKLFVAQIIPLKPDTSTDYDARVRALNAAIPAWASTNSTSTSPIVVVDQFTGYNVATDNVSDGVHPNPAGSDKIAKKWFDAIQGLL